MKFWQTQSFKTLQKAWYERLEDDGFADVEEFARDGEMRLKKSAVHVFREDDRFRDSKEAYYHFVSQQVHETVWTSDVDRLILLRHSEGRKIRHICEELELLGHRRTRGTVRFKIRRYEVIWGIREYSPRQMNNYKSA